MLEIWDLSKITKRNQLPLWGQNRDFEMMMMIYLGIKSKMTISITNSLALEITATIEIQYLISAHFKVSLKAVFIK